jgi:hypothetical protein
LQRGEAGVVSFTEKEKAPSNPSNQSVKKDDKPTPLMLRIKDEVTPDDPSFRQAVLRAIRTKRQKLAREATNRKGCADTRRKEIERKLEYLKGIEEQECGTREPKHPSSRPSARELLFKTETPSADEILEAAAIQQLLRLKKPASKKAALIFAKLSKLDPARWWGEDGKDDEYYKDKIARCEARHNPRIERTRERIDYGDIAKIKFSEVDRVITENYFRSERLAKPLSISKVKHGKPL